MSSIGFPDGQRITQWLGAPIVTATALAIGNVLHTDGPFNLASWASVVVAIKPTGGSVTVTVRQQINGGPAALSLPTTFIVPAGQTFFETIVLLGDTVYIDLTGSAVGVTVDYAVYPSNVTTNAQVLASATINVQHNEVLVAAEATLDFVDAAGFVWTVVDDAPGTRVKVTPPAVGQQGAAIYLSGAAQNVPNAATTKLLLGTVDFDNGGYTDVANNRLKIPAGAPTCDYVVSAGCEWANSGAPPLGNRRQIAVQVNANSMILDSRPPIGGVQMFHGCTRVLRLAAGDIVELFGFQDTGGFLLAGSDLQPYANFLSIGRVA